MKLTLPILFNTDEIEKLELIGQEFTLDKCKINNIIFYSINHISKREDNRTTIGSNGELFICNLTIEEVEKKIDNCLKKELKSFIFYNTNLNIQ